MTEAASNPIRLVDGTVLEGTTPLVLVGPNGSGKSRYGAGLAPRNGHNRIAARRELALHQIPMMTALDARNSITQSKAQANDVSQGENLLTSIIGSLKAEDAQDAISFRDSYVVGAAPPNKTKLAQVSDYWREIFPERQLDLSTHTPTAKWTDDSRATGDYSVATMSDGERSVFYLLARIIEVKPGIIIVDEPEVHLHPLLARRFWDLVERIRTDLRFVYITHDLHFAVSRQSATFGIVKDSTTVQLVSSTGSLPKDIFEGILGAASLSVVANRIVFCEGNDTTSVDVKFYSAWFSGSDTTIAPVGNCTAVRSSVQAFNNSPLIANLHAVGIAERDYWPDSYIREIKAGGLHVLPAGEIEGLLSYPQVAKAIASQVGISDFAQRYEGFERDVRANYSGLKLNKLILERAKTRIDLQVRSVANAAYPHSSLSETRRNFVEAVDIGRLFPEIGKVFDEEELIVRSALEGGAGEFLMVLPGKDCLSLLCQSLGVSRETYVNLIEAALSPTASGDESLASLARSLEAALEPHLPERKVTKLPS